MESPDLISLFDCRYPKSFGLNVSSSKYDQRLYRKTPFVFLAEKRNKDQISKLETARLDLTFSLDRLSQEC